MSLHCAVVDAWHALFQRRSRVAVNFKSRARFRIYRAPDSRGTSFNFAKLNGRVAVSRAPDQKINELITFRRINIWHVT